MVVLLLERDEEMQRLYGTWLKHRQHAVFRCPGIFEQKDGRGRCLLLAGFPCPSCRQADVILYDPTPGEAREQEDVKVVRAIRQSLPGTSVLIVGGREWLAPGIGQLILQDRGIRLASSNPPDLALQVSALEGRKDREFPDIEGDAGSALGIGSSGSCPEDTRGWGAVAVMPMAPANKEEGMSHSSRSLPWPGRISKLRNVDEPMG
ncbi:MAG: hypothetical protein ACE5JO_06960 [Candidatus Binatia bacterium]